MKCPSCNTPLSEKYCPNCGRPAQWARIDGKYIVNEIGSVLSFKKGILFTIKELLIRPGHSINAFLQEDRHRLVKPVIFVIFCSFVYTVLQRLLHFEDSYVEYSSDAQSSVQIIFEWVQGNYGYANILIAIFIAGWIKVFFFKSNFNFYEILILLFFVFGECMLIYSFFGVLESLTGIMVLHIGGLIGFVYSPWAIGQFFGRRNKRNYFKAVASFWLGLISATFTAFLVGILIDWVAK